jgi:acyl-CoA synthetase (AMP-forming)/AMP-acid ligase II
MGPARWQEVGLQPGASTGGYTVLYRSPFRSIYIGEDIDYQGGFMNLNDYLLETAEDDRIAIITSQAQHSYKELRDVTASVVSLLRSNGVQSGDRVGVLGENSLFWVASYLAILKIGAVAVPFATVSTVEDLRTKENFVQCKAFCVDQRSYRRFSGAFEVDLPFIFDDTLKLCVNESGPVSPPVDNLDKDVALMFTSGTTGKPRAVRVTDRNIRANTESIIEYLGLDRDQRILVVLPFYYCFGASLLHTHLRVGGSLVLCNTFAYPETALDMIEQTACTGFAGVPSTYQTLLRNTSFPRRGLKTLRKIQQAGGKLPVVFIKELMAAQPEAQIYVMYGQTEATARLSYLPPELLESKLGSIGLGIPGVRLSVLNEAGYPVKPGEVGEIMAWGENVSPGYMDEPEASAEKFSSGYLHTGDLATVDEDGFIYVVDRKSDFIKCLGHRVSSQEVEADVMQIPEVVSAAAIGVTDEIQGEAIVVFATVKKNTTLTQNDIIAYCRQHMARHMVPKEVIFIDSLPLNAHGKVVKAKLKEMLGVH